MCVARPFHLVQLFLVAVSWPVVISIDVCCHPLGFGIAGGNIHRLVSGGWCSNADARHPERRLGVISAPRDINVELGVIGCRWVFGIWDDLRMVIPKSLTGDHPPMSMTFVVEFCSSKSPL